VELPSLKLSAGDAAVFETFVVPRYLALFADLATDMLLLGEQAAVLHVGCRTGYPDRKLVEQGAATVVGVDSSLPALELARNKAAVLREAPLRYYALEELPGTLEPEGFSNVLSLHPTLGDNQRRQLFQQCHGLLYEGGQAVFALPLRGSFLEVADLFREYALKFDDTAFAELIETVTQARPTIETLEEELEAAGFDDIDVEIRQTDVPFDSGRAFVEDPVTRLLILPELAAAFAGVELAKPFEYARDAIDKYWSEGKLELSLNVGCASARKVGRG
jgi:SAM-dependent methyltransferase